MIERVVGWFVAALALAWVAAVATGAVAPPCAPLHAWFVARGCP